MCKKAKQHLGLLHRKFHQASPQVRSKLYSSMLLPKLEYCSSVWDPHQAKYISMLESVQKFGCRVISKEWNSDYPTLLTHLQLPTLQSHRKQQRLIMCYKILTNTSSIPSSYFTAHPSPSPRLHHNKALFIPLVKTTSFKCSFLLMLFLFGTHSPLILFLVLLCPALNVLLDLISLPLFGSVLLCTFVLVSLSVVGVYWVVSVCA